MKTRHRILVLNPTCLDIIQNHRDWINSLDAEIIADQSFRNLDECGHKGILDNADALILPASIRNFPRERDFERLPSLKTISIAASGYDWLDIGACTRHGIAVSFASVPEGAHAVADMTFGLMLAAARQIPCHHDALRRKNYNRGMGVLVWNKTLGIIGLGNIGRAVARRASGFDMRLLAVEPRPDMEFVRQYGVELVSLDDLLGRSDFVSLHVRLDRGTEGMIGRRELSLMKPGAYLVNTARLKLVDECALAEALLNHRIAGAAMDDPPGEKLSPLLEDPNFVCTPHLGNRAIEGCDAVFRRAIENAIAVLDGRRPQDIVNPEAGAFSTRATTFKRG